MAHKVVSNKQLNLSYLHQVIYNNPCKLFRDPVEVPRIRETPYALE